MHRIFRNALGALALTALAAALFVAPQALAKGEDVTFLNRTDETRYVLVAWGEAKACEDKDRTENFTLEPGQSFVLESGADRACYCVGRVAKVSQCMAWDRARPGSIQRIEQ